MKCRPFASDATAAGAPPTIYDSIANALMNTTTFIGTKPYQTSEDPVQLPRVSLLGRKRLAQLCRLHNPKTIN